MSDLGRNVSTNFLQTVMTTILPAPAKWLLMAKGQLKAQTIGKMNIFKTVQGENDAQR